MISIIRENPLRFSRNFKVLFIFFLLLLFQPIGDRVGQVKNACESYNEKVVARKHSKLQIFTKRKPKAEEEIIFEPLQKGFDKEDLNFLRIAYDRLLITNKYNSDKNSIWNNICPATNGNFEQQHTINGASDKNCSRTRPINQFIKGKNLKKEKDRVREK